MPYWVVNVRKANGFAPADDGRRVVYVGRGSRPGWKAHPLCNEPLKKYGNDRAACLAAYRNRLLARRDLPELLEALRAATRNGELPLGCWCAPLPCHADILAELLERGAGPRVEVAAGTPPDREASAAAYHEAGHAAVAARLGYSLGRVALTPDDPEQFGDILQRWDAPEELRAGGEYGVEKLVRDQLVIRLAGPAAEARAGFDGDLARAEQEDIAELGELVMNVWAEGYERELAACRSRAAELLGEPAVWAGVRSLAGELLRSGTVPGDDAHRVLAGAGIRAGS
jgi:hypothetical protein